MSPTGRSGAAGTARDPWDLQTALAGAGGVVEPGDTVWLLDGTYYGPFTSGLTGTPPAPIVVRQAPGARAVLDGARVPPGEDVLTVNGAYAIYWGFEITHSAPNRTARRPAGVWLRQARHVKLINLLIHDTGMGVFAESETEGCEITGLIIYNGGWQTPERSDGHGLYVKQDGSGSKLIRDNVVFNMYGLGVHAYTDRGSGQLRNMTFEGNVAFNNGLVSDYENANFLIGGEEPADSVVIRQTFTFFPPGVPSRNVRLGFGSVTNGAIVFEDNIAVGGSPVIYTRDWLSGRVAGNIAVGDGTIVDFRDSTRVGYTWSDNDHVRDPTARAWRFLGELFTFAEWRVATGLGGSDQVMPVPPPEGRVIVRPNPYDRGRAHIVVYNWAGLGAVPVNVGGVLRPGDAYEVRSVQALAAPPLLAGTYRGGALVLPLAAITPPPPVGGSPRPPVTTGPAFDVFLLTVKPRRPPPPPRSDSLDCGQSVGEVCLYPGVDRDPAAR